MSISIEQAKTVLTIVHGIVNPTDRQIAMFVLFGYVDKETTA